MSSCDCYKVGGPFIAEDPDCPAHGTQAQAEREQREAQEKARAAEQASLQERLVALESGYLELRERVSKQEAELAALRREKRWPPG